MRGDREFVDPYRPGPSKRSRVAGVFVLGDPKFYSRFGFDPDLAGGFMCRYSGPHLMALALGRELPATEGVIEYAPAFDSLELGDVGRIAGNRKSRDRA